MSRRDMRDINGGLYKRPRYVTDAQRSAHDLL
jgi:hypothetical protein